MKKPELRKINRRHFLKIASGTTVVGVLAFSGIVNADTTQCQHCGIELFGSLELVTSAGICRNCGANARAGSKVALGKSFESKKSNAKQFSASSIEIPFPHPDIQSATTKPCGALSNVNAGRARVRKTYKTS